jgi:hypothetical protein
VKHVLSVVATIDHVVDQAIVNGAQRSGHGAQPGRTIAPGQLK